MENHVRSAPYSVVLALPTSSDCQRQLEFSRDAYHCVVLQTFSSPLDVGNLAFLIFNGQYSLFSLVPESRLFLLLPVYVVGQVPRHLAASFAYPTASPASSFFLFCLLLTTYVCFSDLPTGDCDHCRVGKFPSFHYFLLMSFHHSLELLKESLYFLPTNGLYLTGVIFLPPLRFFCFLVSISPFPL